MATKLINTLITVMINEMLRFYTEKQIFCNADIVIEKPAPNKPLEEYIHYETQLQNPTTVL